MRRGDPVLSFKSFAERAKEGGNVSSFYLVSSHGAIVFYVAAHPNCTTNEIAEAMALTHRTVWGLLGDLRRARMLDVRRDGRRHRYTVNLDAPFAHPCLNGYTLRAVLGQIGSPALRTAASQAAAGSRGFPERN
jgi:hypothetical protein